MTSVEQIREYLETALSEYGPVDTQFQQGYRSCLLYMYKQCFPEAYASYEKELYE